jgi:CheY-like chemotaxis protein
MGQKVLLADDSITVQKIVKLSLTEEGIEVIALGNGEQAVQQLATLQPDLVMADVFMPGKDGYEVCEFVKAHPQFKHIPVILLVHAFEPFDPDRAKKVGADHQLTKPFQSIRTLVTTVQDLLQTAAAGATSAAPEQAETARAAASPEPAAAPVFSPPPSHQPEEEFAVVSSLTAAASPLAEPEAPLGNLTMAGFAAPPAPISFTPTTPLTEASLPLPPTSANGFIDLSPPPELPVLPPTDWQPAQPAFAATPVEAPPPEMFSSSFAPLSLAATPALTDANAGDDVLDLGDVLLPDTSGLPLTLETPRAHQATNDVPLLAVLGMSPAATEETAAQFPLADSAPPSFSERFDVGAGQLDLRAEALASASPVQDVKTGTMTSEAAPTALPIPEAVIEEIVNRVVRQLSTKAIQEVAWEVVPEMAELLIRKQISQHPRLAH